MRPTGAEETRDLQPGLDDPRVIRALEEYEAGLKAGGAPDRAALLARYPDVREALDECLDGLEFLHLPAPPADWPAEPPPGEALTQRPLGDYQLVREVGRGGMGVVYEAVQLSLGRRVALKVLPFAAALDARKLQRFKHEAEAAALFHHPNIVPVHAVGCERGVHFYVMQFVDGQDLASLIRELRDGDDARPAAAEATTRAALATERSAGSPGYVRGVATLGAQVAAALDHAHAEGVVHRDIKPANLLVDGQGNPWVTDFGLARLHDGDLTVTGDVLGTIRYMSPEQAQGKRAEVDHRTDVYSLGATLYELLTLRPAFDGATRAEVLNKVLREDPAPVRRLNPAVPEDLETIVLKAMAKEPADRYRTAAALAEDLRRFLEHRPVLARRPTAAQRLSRWSRRNQPVVWAGAAAAAVCAAVLAVTLAVVWDARGDAVRALGSEKEARGEVERALKSEQIARARSERNVALAFDVLAPFTPPQTRRFLPGPIPPETRRPLEAALGFYLKFAETNRDAPTERGLAAQASRRAALIQIRLGRLADAEAALRTAVELGERAAADFPDQPAHRHAAGTAYGDLGYVLTRTNRRGEAEAAHRRGVQTLRAVAADHPGQPEYRLALANALSNLGSLLQAAGRPGEAEAAHRDALATLDRLQDDHPARAADARQIRSSVTDQLGAALRQQRRFDEAEQALRESLDLRRALAADAKAATGRDDAEALAVKAEAAYELAGVLAGVDKFAEAEPLYREAIEDQRRLADSRPEVLAHRADLGVSYHDLSRTLAKAGRRPDAEAAAREARDVYAKLAAEAPGIPVFRYRLGFEHQNLGLLLRESGRPADAAAEHARAADVRARLAEEFPGEAEHRYHLGLSLRDRGIALHRAGRVADAEASAGRAVEVLEALVAGQPKNLMFRQSLTDAHLVHFSPLLDGGKTAEAERAARRAVAVAAELLREQPTDSHARLLAYAHRQHGRALERLGQAREAGDAFRRSLDAAPDDPDALAALAVHLADAAEGRDPARAAELARKATDVGPRSGPAWSALGLALYRGGDPAGAVRALDRAAAASAGGPREGLLLALAHAAQGNADEGRRRYESARRRLADAPPPDPTTERLAAEAKAVFDPSPTP